MIIVALKDVLIMSECECVGFNVPLDTIGHFGDDVLIMKLGC